VSDPLQNPVAEETGWACLAFTTKQWDLINVAVMKLMSVDLIKESFGADNVNYVYKWTKAVGSQP